jgi:hypothetical protein
MICCHTDTRCVRWGATGATQTARSREIVPPDVISKIGSLLPGSATCLTEPWFRLRRCRGLIVTRPRAACGAARSAVGLATRAISAMIVIDARTTQTTAT